MTVTYNIRFLLFFGSNGSNRRLQVFCKFFVSLFLVEVSSSITIILLSNVISFNLRISFCICSGTNANAKPLYFLVFSFTGMFILHVSLRYLVDLKPNNSQRSLILVSKLRFPMYIFLGSCSFFLPDDCFCHCVSPIFSFLVGNTCSSLFPSSTDGFYTVSRIEVCVSRSDLMFTYFSFLVVFSFSVF